MNTPKDQQFEEINENECLDISICFQELEDLAWQPSNLGEYRQLSLWRSTPTLNQSSSISSQEYQFTPISETTTPNLESLTSLPVDSPAQVHQTQENELDYLTQNQHFGEKELEYCSKLNPNSVLSNSLKELSDEDFELFLADSIWQDIQQKLNLSRQQALGRVIKDSGYLSFPTLTSGQTSSKMRPAGQTKCEKWFKDNGLIPNGSQLGTSAIASMMGFPSNWFTKLSGASEDLTNQYSKNVTIPKQPIHQEESELDISQDEQSHQDKQRSPLEESSISQKLLGGDENSPLQKDKRSSPSREISIPCLVKQPKQQEAKGVIRQDKGDRFLVYIPDSDSTVTVSKLFVYPDFSESVGQIEKNPRKNLTLSKNNPRKNRRRKNGQGNGSIYYRAVTKNGRQYTEAYYHYVENGKKRTKYIPRKFLDRVSEAESRSLPVADILFLLGGDKKNPRKSSSISSIEVEHKINDGCIEQVLETDENNPRKITPPSKKRKKGYGTGYIECKPIKRGNKTYPQYWYHYEFWQGGDRIMKKSRYIPKRLLARVEKLEAEKAPVRKILEVLGKR
jgi:hypothetical protein